MSRIRGSRAVARRRPAGIARASTAAAGASANGHRRCACFTPRTGGLTWLDDRLHTCRLERHADERFERRDLSVRVAYVHAGAGVLAKKRVDADLRPGLLREEWSAAVSVAWPFPDLQRPRKNARVALVRRVEGADASYYKVSSYLPATIGRRLLNVPYPTTRVSSPLRVCRPNRTETSGTFPMAGALSSTTTARSS